MHHGKLISSELGCTFIQFLFLQRACVKGKDISTVILAVIFSGVLSLVHRSAIVVSHKKHKIHSVSYDFPVIDTEFFIVVCIVSMVGIAIPSAYAQVTNKTPLMFQ